MRPPTAIEARHRTDRPPRPNPLDRARTNPHEPLRRPPPPCQHAPTVRAPQLPTRQHPFDDNRIRTYAEQRCLRARMNGPSPGCRQSRGKGRFSFNDTSPYAAVLTVTLSPDPDPAPSPPETVLTAGGAYGPARPHPG
jgi:hypothetical protein